MTKVFCDSCNKELAHHFTMRFTIPIRDRFWNNKGLEQIIKETVKEYQFCFDCNHKIVKNIIETLKNGEK